MTRVARYHNVYGPHGTWKGGREKAPAAFCRKAACSTDFFEMWGDGERKCARESESVCARSLGQAHDRRHYTAAAVARVHAAALGVRQAEISRHHFDSSPRTGAGQSRLR